MCELLDSDELIWIVNGITYCGDCATPNCHLEHCCELNCDNLSAACVGFTNVLG
jgi:hypothetical protein